MAIAACKVVVGVDGSPSSVHALWVAVEEARQRYAPLHVVHVAVGAAFAGAAAAAPVAGALPGLLGSVDPHQGGLLVEDALIELFGGVPADISISVMVSRPPTGPALLREVSAGDLLVVGRSRRGLLRRVFVGSVSAYCVAHAPCPVLIVPAPAVPRRTYAVRRSRKDARK